MAKIKEKWLLLENGVPVSTSWGLEEAVAAMISFTQCFPESNWAIRFDGYVWATR